MGFQAETGAIEACQKMDRPNGSIEFRCSLRIKLSTQNSEKNSAHANASLIGRPQDGDSPRGPLRAPECHISGRRPLGRHWLGHGHHWRRKTPSAHVIGEPLSEHGLFTV